VQFTLSNSNTSFNSNGKKLLLVALSLVFITHGIVIYFTLPQTYDAFVHIFFADHYKRFWFEPWEYRWYTGFVTTSYPPLVHQAIAIIGKLFPLKIAFCIYAIFVFNVLVIGVYRFSKLFFNKSVAGVASIVAVLLSSLIETLHVYGQMPTLTGIAFLLNALPFLYNYIVLKKTTYLLMALSFLSVVICSHHVTAIFGMVFFIAPTIFMALVDTLPKESLNTSNFFYLCWKIIKQAFVKHKQLIVFIVLVIFLAIGLIYPYWHWSKSDPINQVSIPHGSRDNFLKNTSSGLIFFVIPLYLIFALFPAIFFAITKYKRFWGWTISFLICIVLGSGGTTPFPKLLLGSNAFNILTLDRFGFWASIIAIPFIANFIFSFLNGTVKDFWIKKIKASGHFTLASMSAFAYLLFTLFIFHLASFRPLQPKEIDIKPIVNFLNRDEHLRWRFLTLGFGDQMAWLSANSLAASVDGNYHSARRLPELTTRPIERLENAKFNGQEGLASLNDFLTKAEKYNLKYVFSNDRYYDPLLFYTGWSRTIRLENGIMVWEKSNISTIKPITPKYLNNNLKLLWGVLPMASLAFAILLTIFYLVKLKKYSNEDGIENQEINYPIKVIYLSSALPLVFFSTFLVYRLYELLLVREQKNPSTTIINFYNYLDFQEFELAHGFFKKSPTYPLDQYLLEKSVKDGGLLPSYAKLDSIHTNSINENESIASIKVFTRWRTALGFRNVIDTFNLEKQNNKWYILPKPFSTEIPKEQVRDYTYNIFKKQGKRFISSFPTIKDDRIKKPFAAYKQVNILSNQNNYYVTGELLNADDIAISVSTSVKVFFNDSTSKIFYPNTKTYYNLSPKESTFFQVDLEGLNSRDIKNILKVDIITETDVSERGYYHGGSLLFTSAIDKDVFKVDCSMYNELTTEINVPGVLLAEKNTDGTIVQVETVTHTNSIRSGLSEKFSFSMPSVAQKVVKMNIPTTLFINGQLRSIAIENAKKSVEPSNGISLLPHCFISQEIYLQ